VATKGDSYKWRSTSGYIIPTSSTPNHPTRTEQLQVALNAWLKRLLTSTSSTYLHHSKSGQLQVMPKTRGHTRDSYSASNILLLYLAILFLLTDIAISLLRSTLCPSYNLYLPKRKTNGLKLAEQGNQEMGFPLSIHSDLLLSLFVNLCFGQCKRKVVGFKVAHSYDNAGAYAYTQTTLMLSASSVCDWFLTVSRTVEKSNIWNLMFSQQ
jgi:hypothetical protein